jgi:SAM-dependent methyltransferase
MPPHGGEAMTDAGSDGIEPSGWVEITRENPEHSSWYVERFRAMVAAGDDLAGEARFVDAMVARGARILDAGCGPGRVGSALAQVGHQVIGIDVDPFLIAAVKQDHPDPLWLVGDLAELDLPAQGITDGFDAIVCAGNVMPFLAASTRVTVLDRFRTHLRPGGRAAVGFGAGRDYTFDEFFADVERAGLTADVLLESWDLRPFTNASEFLVAILTA